MADTGYSGIADYLAQQRNYKALSQEMLAEELSGYSSCFEGIDGLAISRWERGAVSPGNWGQTTFYCEGNYLKTWSVPNYHWKTSRISRR